MKFKDILIIIFLAGLLLYAACHRAGLIGRENLVALDVEADIIIQVTSDTVKFENWFFYSHPETGLTVLTETGEVLHHIPEFRSGDIELITEPDPSGATIGKVYVRGECSEFSPCFKINHEGNLEIASI